LRSSAQTDFFSAFIANGEKQSGKTTPSSYFYPKRVLILHSGSGYVNASSYPIPSVERSASKGMDLKDAWSACLYFDRLNANGFL
jgi:hypothetical protein